MTSRLFKVFLEARGQVLIVGGFCHLRKGLNELLLGAVEILEFVDECVVQVFEFHSEMLRPHAVGIASESALLAGSGISPARGWEGSRGMLSGEHGVMKTMEEHTHLHELLERHSIAMLVTQDASGALRARPMAIARVEESGRLWFLSADDTAKVQEIASQGRALVVCQDRHSQVVVEGPSEIRRDPAKARELWRESFKVWFPEGAEDPSLVLISVDPESGEYWDERGGQGLRYLAKAAVAYIRGERPEVDESEVHGKVEH